VSTNRQVSDSNPPNTEILRTSICHAIGISTGMRYAHRVEHGHCKDKNNVVVAEELTRDCSSETLARFGEDCTRSWNVRCLKWFARSEQHAK